MRGSRRQKLVALLQEVQRCTPSRILAQAPAAWTGGPSGGMISGPAMGCSWVRTCCVAPPGHGRPRAGGTPRRAAACFPASARALARSALRTASLSSSKSWRLTYSRGRSRRRSPARCRRRTSGRCRCASSGPRRVRPETNSRKLSKSISSPSSGLGVPGVASSVFRAANSGAS